MIPKYERICNEMLEELKGDHFLPGDRFYSESDIKKKYEVSSITAVKVLNELANSGHVYRVQGKGTFVAKGKISQLVRFSDIENHSPSEEEINVLEIQEEKDPLILKQLKLATTESYYTIIRVRSAKNIPFLLHITHLPKKFMKLPIHKKSSEYSSVYDRIKKDFGIDFFSLASEETNEIVFPEDEKIKKILSLSEKDPVVKQKKWSYLKDQTVAEYIVSYKHWRFYKTKIEVEAR